MQTCLVATKYIQNRKQYDQQSMCKNKNVCLCNLLLDGSSHHIIFRIFIVLTDRHLSAIHLYTMLSALGILFVFTCRSTYSTQRGLFYIAADDRNSTN